MKVTKVSTIETLREGVLGEMERYLNDHIMEEAHKCAKRLLLSFPQQAVPDSTVFVAYGGGKDSSYMTAFARLLQILIYQEQGVTFKLRIATNRHAGMPHTVMENIDRIYQALGAYDDPDVEMLLIDGNDVHAFDVKTPLPQEVVSRNRLDILVTGHQCEGEARPTFCNACNLSLVNSFSRTLSYQGGVDIIITGDSKREQRAYFSWMRQVAAKLGVPLPRGDKEFRSFLQATDQVAQSYFKGIYGESKQDETFARRIQTDTIQRNPIFFSIYEDTSYEAGEHWDFLIHFLKFQFDELAFSFTESDCSHPALMAHLRGLKAEHVYQRTYEEGINEYVTFATSLMESKQYPPHLIADMKARYESSESIYTMREKLDDYTEKVLDLAECHLVCMLYSPFIQHGAKLSAFLEKEHPDLCPHLADIHLLLSGAPDIPVTEALQEIRKRLQDISHLEMRHLQILYQTNLVAHEKLPRVISVVLTKDPHKAVIQTKHSPEGPVQSELISGR